MKKSRREIDLLGSKMGFRIRGTKPSNNFNENTIFPLDQEKITPPFLFDLTYFDTRDRLQAFIGGPFMGL